MKKKVYYGIIFICFIAMGLLFNRLDYWSRDLSFQIQFAPYSTTAIKSISLFVFGLLISAPKLTALFSKSTGTLKIRPFYLVLSVILFIASIGQLLYYSVFINFISPELDVLAFSNLGFGGLEIFMAYASSSVLLKGLERT